MSVQSHIQSTEQFIRLHPELSSDGDIFTPAPEAESGRPFNPLDSPTKTARFRQFLVDDQRVSDNAFKGLISP